MDDTFSEVLHIIKKHDLNISPIFFMSLTNLSNERIAQFKQEMDEPDKYNQVRLDAENAIQTFALEPDKILLENFKYNADSIAVLSIVRKMTPEDAFGTITIILYELADIDLGKNEKVITLSYLQAAGMCMVLLCCFLLVVVALIML